MLEIQEIRELIKLIDESSIDEFKFEQNGSKVTMKKQTGQPTHLSTSTLDTGNQHTNTDSYQVQPKQEALQTTQATEKETETVEESKGIADGLHTITSPMVGTFYESPSPDSSAYVKTGDRVKQDSVVCIVEAMKLMNEIESEVNGEIVEILVENGQLVEYGQELFLVKPE
ncbi:acetyl-CoA carboxylase biotin carboxyl carrier protein [Salipaludibacillus sp. HK11]|uniref:acetyl-CoA carboxylase biotin carboxyl carrier protein n=1 Tax=Salipaludibacillus sp. HK11 TaxID=3394320 RepID=UPI0039FD6FD6